MRGISFSLSLSLCVPFKTYGTLLSAYDYLYSPPSSNEMILNRVANVLLKFLFVRSRMN